jgi:hypothetical protein
MRVPSNARTLAPAGHREPGWCLDHRRRIRDCSQTLDRRRRDLDPRRNGEYHRGASAKSSLNMAGAPIGFGVTGTSLIGLATIDTGLNEG